MKKVHFLSAIPLSLLLFYAWHSFDAKDLTFDVTEKQNGVCWVAGPREMDSEALSPLLDIGVSHISQTPFGWQTDPNQPEIQWEIHSDRIWWGESLVGLKATTDMARDKGIESLLKPHLWIRGSWPGEVEMQSEEDWKKWFSAYQEFIVYFATFAEKERIPMLCVGTELEKTTHREKEWRGIIREVKKVYSGKLTYAANFTEYEQVNFWDELDFIGVQAYFPLSKKENPSLKMLKSSWEAVIPKIEKIVRNFDKPVIFTEIGYCNTEDAAIAPWVWPNERKESVLSEEIQARCYQAFFETAYQKKWLAGVYFWKWYPETRDRSPDFTPQGKFAEVVMKNYFLRD